MLLGERFEHGLLKLFAHADAGILNRKAAGNPAIRYGIAGGSIGDGTAPGCVFDSIREQIYRNLVKTDPVHDNAFAVSMVALMDHELLSLLATQGRKNLAQPLHISVKTIRFRVQFNLAAFGLGTIQNIV